MRVEISVPEGDEEKDVVLLHRDIPVSEFEKDTNTWEVISNICWPIGPGRVAVDVNAFCFMILSFPFSGMDSLRKILPAPSAPEGPQLWARSSLAERTSRVGGSRAGA